MFLGAKKLLPKSFTKQSNQLGWHWNEEGSTWRKMTAISKWKIMVIYFASEKWSFHFHLQRTVWPFSTKVRINLNTHGIALRNRRRRSLISVFHLAFILPIISYFADFIYLRLIFKNDIHCKHSNRIHRVKKTSLCSLANEQRHQAKKEIKTMKCANDYYSFATSLNVPVK